MRFFISVILLLLSLALFPQTGHNNFSKLDIFSGLSHNQVNTILKDPEDFFGLAPCPAWIDMMDIHSRSIGVTPDDSSSLVDKRLLRISEQQRLRQINNCTMQRLYIFIAILYDLLSAKGLCLFARK